ncbi:MAG: ATP-binding cassette domain-containing protein, partial [Burkholderiales bacterium]|nr:ATP-binding cassette domain-containing protein [Burkholderiales bacterium]
MSGVRLQNISKFYRLQQVLHEISMQVHDGEFMVFVGPSGCGKSTLLRMIAGLEEISSGDLWIDDKLANAVPPAKRGLAMVFQSYALYPHMSVYDNMAFSLSLTGMARAAIDDAVQKAAAILQITPLLQRKPRDLSGGQRQRVAIGRAIVRQPGLFLFDEPLSNLDAGLRVQMRMELSKLHRELGATMIYVTHDQVEAMTLGQRIAVFNGGRIEQLGTPLDLYEHPANLFVAGFLGTPKMNFLRGKVVDIAALQLQIGLDDGG